MAFRMRATTALAVCSGVSGLLAYVFFAVVTRALGAEPAAPVSVLWAYWSFVSAALTFPVQHWITRTVHATGGEAAVRRALGGVVWVAVGVALAAVTVSWPVREDLFGSEGAAFPLLVAAVTLGAALAGYVRGVLGGRGRFGLIGASLVLENGTRCVVAAVAILAGVEQPAAYGACLVVGYLAAAAWPVYRLGRTGSASRSAVAFLGGAAGGQLIAQVVLTCGPVVLALAGGAPGEVTALFAGLALFRAPYTFAIGAVAPLTAHLTRWVVEGRTDRLRALRIRVQLTGAAAVGVALALGWLLGPWLLRTVFGSDVELSRGICAVLAAGSVLALVNLVSTVTLLALARTSRLVLAWAAALVPGVLWFALAPVSPLGATVGAFVVVEAAAVLLLARAEASVADGK